MTVGRSEIRHPFAPLAVGRRLDLLGAGCPQLLRRGVDVVGVHAELELPALVLRPSLRDGDAEGIELQEGEVRRSLRWEAVDLVEAEIADVELRGAGDVVDVEDRERLAETGHPCASCHETTGLRSTPILSISASITSPGRRYSDAASSLKPATPLTVPVDTTSPAE